MTEFLIFTLSSRPGSIQTELKGFPELSRWNWESDEAKEARVHRAECQREERAAGEESFGEVQIISRKHSPEH